ncbi:MAG: glycosyltransferase family 2 protein, partial [Phycisphaerales bacterium JB059]
MTISVIIPTYNRAQDCARAIESCIRQLGDYDEIVVVDDGSTDDTIEVLQTYVNRLPGVVRVFQQENAGVGVARNTAIREATGDTIVLLDSDDILLPWTLERVREANERFDYPAIIAGPTPFFEDPAEIDVSETPDAGASYHRDLLSCWKKPPYLPGSGVAVQRRYLEEIGGFFPHRHLGEDIDLYLRLGEKPGFVLYDHPIYAQYRPRSCAHTGISQNPQSVFKSCQYLLEHLRSGTYGQSDARARERRAWVTATTRPS